MILTLKQTQAIDILEDQTTTELYYGGAAGGGKTSIGCYWQLKRRIRYPGTRGLLGRSVLKTLKETTLATFFKVAKMQGIIRGLDFELTSAQHAEMPNSLVFDNGSMIYLKDLYSNPTDPDFDELGSLEITDGFLDESTQITVKAKNVVRSRIRYGLNENNLIPKLLMSGNPGKNWPYYEFYRPNKDGTIREDRKFIQALPGDNENLPESYIKSLEGLDKNSRQRLLYGNWEYDDDPTVLCDYDAIVDCFTNEHVLPTNDHRISSDLAMQGRDRFVTGVWQGLVVTVKVDKQKSTGKEIETDLRDLMINFSVGRTQTIADSDGMGSYLESYLTGIKEFHGGSTAINDQEFVNLKSECGFKLAEFVNRRQIRIICTAEQRERIIEELGVLKSKNVDADETRKRLIKKEEMKEILGHSPDYLDMLLMGMFFHLKPQLNWLPR